MKMTMKLLLLMVVVVAIVQESKALTICKMSEDGLKACKPSVTQPNPVDPRQTKCCDALKEADLNCLCTYKGSLGSLGIDPKLAMSLPAKCGCTPPANC